MKRWLIVMGCLLLPFQAQAGNGAAKMFLAGTQVAYSFPANGVFETFTGTDNTTPPNANWTNQLNTIKILSNTAAGGTADASNFASYATAYTTNSIELYATVTSIGNSGDVLWLVFTNAGYSDGYVIQYTFGSGTTGVYKWTSGWIGAQIGSNLNQVVSAGGSIGFSRTGSTIKVYYKASGGSWGQLGSDFTDASYTDMTKFSINIYGTLMRIDNVGGGGI